MTVSRIREGDQVMVVAGRARGQRGTVSKKRKDGRVFITGVNTVKKTVRPDPNEGVQGGIEEREAPLHISNVMLYNAASQMRDRAAVQSVEKAGTKRNVRVYKSSGETIDS